MANQTQSTINHDGNNNANEGVYVPTTVANTFSAGQGVVNAQGGTAAVDANLNYYAPTVTQIADRTNNQQFAAVDPFGTLSVRGNLPAIVQKAQNVSTGSVSTLVKAFSSTVTAGNTIVVLAGCGNGTAMTVADSASNTYYQAVNSANSTTFEAAIFYAPVTTGGTVTVTVTNAGSAASMAMEIYEVSGLLAIASNQPDSFVGATGTSATASTTTLTPSIPNGIAFLAVGVGTAAQAVSATAGTFWTLDSTQNTTTPAGLFTFGALSQSLGALPSLLPKATIAASEPFAAAAAIFRPVALPVLGQVAPVAGTANGALPYHLVSAASTNATVVKAGPGTVYQVTLNCNTSAAARYLKFYDSASTPTAGAGTIVYVVQAPLLAASTGSTTTVQFPTGLKFANGIAFVTVTTLADAGNTAVGAGDLSIDLAYA